MELTKVEGRCKTCKQETLVEVEGVTGCLTCVAQSQKKVSKQNGFGDSKELGRVQTSDSIEVIVSKGPKGYSITRYMTSEGYTGWRKGGIFIPEDILIEFLKLFGVENLGYAVDELGGADGQVKDEEITQQAEI